MERTPQVSLKQLPVAKIRVTEGANVIKYPHDRPNDPSQLASQRALEGLWRFALATLECSRDTLWQLLFAALKGLWRLLFVMEQSPEKFSDNYKPLKRGVTN